MADGAETVGGACLAHTIYIWPSRALVARSWDWPEAWHEAFAQAASQLGGLVATYVLGGLPVVQQSISVELRAGCVSFSVECRGTSIYIAVSDFEGPDEPGPDAPGPNGGTRRQPYAADGLVLGLRGTGKSFTVVTFYGPLPPIPAGNSVAPRINVVLLPRESGRDSLHAIRHSFLRVLPDGLRGSHGLHHDRTSDRTSERLGNGQGAASPPIAPAITTHRRATVTERAAFMSPYRSYRWRSPAGYLQYSGAAYTRAKLGDQCDNRIVGANSFFVKNPRPAKDRTCMEKMELSDLFHLLSTKPMNEPQCQHLS
jgi:hypothetical protein